MDLVRQIAGTLFAPMSIALMLCSVALILRWRSRRRMAAVVLGGAAAFLYLCSIYPVADLLLAPLESRYPPLGEAGIAAPHYVVVLGSSFAPRGDVPVTGALDGDGLARIVEGIRLLRKWPGATLIASGGAPQGRTAPARGYERLARELGVDDARLIVLDQPTNTAAEAAEITKIVGAQRFVLVTSAFHMPRAMAEMRRHGLQPLPAPTAHRYDPTIGYRLGSLVPGARALQRSEFAFHEYLGLLALEFGASG